jgi:hypothetical protein
MRIARLCAVLLFLATRPCYGQMMDKAQYREQLKRADDAARRWEKQLNSIDLDKLKVSYSTGRSIEKARSTLLDNFLYMHRFIAEQLVSESLSGDIMIENTLGDVVSPVDTLIDLLPTTGDGNYWLRTLGPMGEEMMGFQIPLRKHINILAENLQLKAEVCSR